MQSITMPENTPENLESTSAVASAGSFITNNRFRTITNVAVLLVASAGAQTRAQEQSVNKEPLNQALVQSSTESSELLYEHMIVLPAGIIGLELTDGTIITKDQPNERYGKVEHVDSLDAVVYTPTALGAETVIEAYLHELPTYTLPKGVIGVECSDEKHSVLALPHTPYIPGVGRLQIQDDEIVFLPDSELLQPRFWLEPEAPLVLPKPAIEHIPTPSPQRSNQFSESLHNDSAASKAPIVIEGFTWSEQGKPMPTGTNIVYFSDGNKIEMNFSTLRSSSIPNYGIIRKVANGTYVFYPHVSRASESVHFGSAPFADQKQRRIARSSQVVKHGNYSLAPRTMVTDADLQVLFNSDVKSSFDKPLERWLTTMYYFGHNFANYDQEKRRICNTIEFTQLQSGKIEVEQKKRLSKAAEQSLRRLLESRHSQLRSGPVAAASVVLAHQKHAAQKLETALRNLDAGNTSAAADFVHFKAYWDLYAMAENLYVDPYHNQLLQYYRSRYGKDAGIPKYTAYGQLFSLSCPYPRSTKQSSAIAEYSNSKMFSSSDRQSEIEQNRAKVKAERKKLQKESTKEAAEDQPSFNLFNDVFSDSYRSKYLESNEGIDVREDIFTPEDLEPEDENPFKPGSIY